MKYDSKSDHDILVIVAEATDRQEKHLGAINNPLNKHEKRIMKMALRREVEEEMGVKPPSRKRKLTQGGMYGGFGALIVSVVFKVGQMAGWW